MKNLSQWAILALASQIYPPLRSLQIETSPSMFAMAMMGMKTMLMGDSLDHFLSDLISFGNLSDSQKMEITDISNRFKSEDDPHEVHQNNMQQSIKGKQNLFGAVEVLNELPGNLFGGANPTDSVASNTEEENDKNGVNSSSRYKHSSEDFSTEESKQALRDYLLFQLDREQMDEETAEIIASTLGLGALFETGSLVPAGALLNGPVEKGYEGEGHLERVGRWHELTTDPSYFYNGIWGYATGDREYALQCHGNGLNIIDITDPTNPFRVQVIEMGGGGIWRDVATHRDSNSGKTYAYVGAQGNHGGGDPDLYVVDLSYLSGDANNPHGADENPIPEGSNGYLNVGERNYGHTLNVDRGLLFVHSAYNSVGCRVFDLTENPMAPKFLFSTEGSGYACHDSSIMTDVDGKDLLVVSDGGGRRQRIWDVTDVDATWPTNLKPTKIGETAPISGIYAHSNWATEDNRYLFSWDEFNQIDMSVHDISDPTNPVQIGLFQYSGNAIDDARPHNGQILGNYLFVAHYEAGLVSFDISNPYAPFEIGQIETYRDPDGDGVFERTIIGDYEGAWNLYLYLPSRNILVSDMRGGLFVIKATAPYPPPDPPSVSIERDGSDNIVLNWEAVENARGYSVEYSSTIGGQFVVVAEHMTSTSFVHTFASSEPHYKVKAVNGEGVGASSVISFANDPTITPTKIPSLSPSSMPSFDPSSNPTTTPSISPTTSPSRDPTNSPSSRPSLDPSQVPSSSPSHRPSFSLDPSAAPSTKPTASTSMHPSLNPSVIPSSAPSLKPSFSQVPSAAPSKSPSSAPSISLSFTPSIVPSTTSSTSPTLLPSSTPSAVPSTTPINSPSTIPSLAPSMTPSTSPSTFPSLFPSAFPTRTPTSTSPLVLVGNKGKPKEAYPLNACEGNCKKNSECAGDLECFKLRNAGPVPNCEGIGQKKKGYCYDPNKSNSGLMGSRASWGTGPTGPISSEELILKGNKGKPVEAYPLGVCEGNCKNNGDCVPGLVCLKRTNFEPVAGCIGEGEKGKNYCHNPIA
mmetsp:Transcript_28245/g.60416  ORF Transcript_28245/g.60416 Transcript_28245/m.60416 type:complete len:1030 (+) Transcript_28245:37-3126(+)